MVAYLLFAEVMQNDSTLNQRKASEEIFQFWGEIFKQEMKCVREIIVIGQ